MEALSVVAPDSSPDESFYPVPVPVPESFPVWVASAMLEPHAFAEFVLGGSVRFVGPQFFHTNGVEACARQDAATFKPGAIVYALLALDYSGRRIALCRGGRPVVWSEAKRAIGAWDALRTEYGIKGFRIRSMEAWKR